MFLVLYSSTIRQLLVFADDDDDLGARLCCSAMGRGQKARSPTVPVSQLSELRQSDGRAQQDAMLRGPARGEPEQATTSCAG